MFSFYYVHLRTIVRNSSFFLKKINSAYFPQFTVPHCSLIFNRRDKNPLKDLSLQADLSILAE